MRTFELSPRDLALSAYGRMRENCIPASMTGGDCAAHSYACVHVPPDRTRSILCSLQASRIRRSFGPAEITKCIQRCRARPLQRPALPPAACSSIFRNAATVLARTRIVNGELGAERRANHALSRVAATSQEASQTPNPAPPRTASPRPAPPRTTTLPSTSTCRSHLQSARSRVTSELCALSKNPTKFGLASRSKT